MQCAIDNCQREGTWYVTGVPIDECDDEGTKLKNFYLCVGHAGDLDEFGLGNSNGPAGTVLIEGEKDVLTHRWVNWFAGAEEGLDAGDDVVIHEECDFLST